MKEVNRGENRLWEEESGNSKGRGDWVKGQYFGAPREDASERDHKSLLGSPSLDQS